MRNTLKALKSCFFFLVLLTSIIACDKDFNTIDSDVLGEGNANFTTGSFDESIITSNKKLEGVQINNLPANLLGVFKDPNFGTSTASIVTQITPSNASLSEDFGVNAVIESVVINIPYFSTITGVDENNSSIPKYNLDSLYGNNNAPIKLSIYQNNYYLLDFDPSGSVNSTQNYFSVTENLDDPTHNYASNGSQIIDFDNKKGDLIYEDTMFTNDTEAIELIDTIGTEEVTTYQAPALRITLEKDIDNNAIAFWQDAIVSKNGQDVLTDANSFREDFRGLYIKAEAISDDGSMILLNLESTDANITINYEKGEENSRIKDSYVLNFSGNKLNTFNNTFSFPETDGDQTLYIKGLEGSMAVIDIEDAVNDFKNQSFDENGDLIKLINEAHLIVYDSINDGDTSHKYDRIYAYDIKNNTPIVDYRIDPTLNESDALNSKVISLGQREESGRYKIRITEHLNNIIQNDSTNYKIGLVLSNNVNAISNSEILNADTNDVTNVPSASVISPRGTILHGSNSSNEEKQLKLKVFFTEPK